MKKVLLTILALGTSVSAMANSPYDVCESIRNHTPYQERVTKCMNIVSRNQIDMNIIPLLIRLAKSNTSEVLNSLKAVSNKKIQFEATEACESILTHSPYKERVTSCTKKIADNQFEPSVIKLISNLARQNSTEALNSIDKAANRSFQIEAVQTCTNLMQATPYKERVTSCIKKIADQDFDPAALSIVDTLTKSNANESLNSISAIANNYFQIEGLNVCSAILTNTPYKERVTACFKSIANKSFAYGSTTPCERTARSNTTEALSCLRAAARTYTPTPTPRPNPIPTNSEEIIVDLADITKIKRQANRAKKMIERGQTQRATTILENLVQLAKELETRSERY